MTTTPATVAVVLIAGLDRPSAGVFDATNEILWRGASAVRSTNDRSTHSEASAAWVQTKKCQRSSRRGRCERYGGPIRKTPSRKRAMSPFARWRHSPGASDLDDSMHRRLQQAIDL